ncbi:MAG: histidine kinase [Sinobacteraceae bacterium]|nr:histidine kinase [Nevskia sp.]MDI3260165.1 histidine kinase [Nevskiaceae bacterium]
MKRTQIRPQFTGSLIPNFCTGRALAQLALAIEMVVIVLSLASTAGNEAMQLRFVSLSLFLQWMALCSAAVLCAARRFLKLATVQLVFLVCWGLLLLVTLGLSLAAWWLDQTFGLGVPLGDTPWPFTIRNLLISAIVSLMLLRYFWERHQWQEQARAESEARYLALQARIRPHFLFNSLNSLAELIGTQPEKAEEMVVDLADLFRVSLDARNRLVTLREEIEIVKGYLRIEEIRLGDKLLVNWDLAEDTLDAQLPRLVLQPLVENAVHHGVSRLRARGFLHVSSRREGEYLILDVENPLPPPEAGPRTEGTGTAVNNIAQRIKLIYGDRARLVMGRENSEVGPLFRTRLRLPFVLHSSESMEAGEAP